MDPHVTLIDSGAAVAADVEAALDEKKLRNPSRQKPNLEFYVSDLPARFAEIGERFLGRTMGRVHRVSGF
jgi:glutamate racemase